MTMGNDDINRIFGKLDSLATGQATIAANQSWTMRTLDAHGKTLENIAVNGCEVGRQHTADLAAMKASCPNGGHNGRKENGDRDWLEIGKGTIKAHGSTALVILVILAQMWYLRVSRVSPKSVITADTELRTFIVAEVQNGIQQARLEWKKEHKE